MDDEKTLTGEVRLLRRAMHDLQIAITKHGMGAEKTNSDVGELKAEVAKLKDDVIALKVSEAGNAPKISGGVKVGFAILMLVLAALVSAVAVQLSRPPIQVMSAPGQAQK